MLIHQFFAIAFNPFYIAGSIIGYLPYRCGSSVVSVHSHNKVAI